MLVHKKFVATLLVVLFATSAGAQWTHIPSTDPGWVTNAMFPDWSPSSYGWPTGDDDSVIALWLSNEYAEYLFTGTQVRLYGIKSSEGATADIKIDGQVVAAGVSWYKSGQPQDHVMLFESAVLSDGAHTFRVDNPGDWINIDYIEIVSTEDTSPPTPDPMTWLTVPVAFPGNEIVMTATTASDPSGVEYYFDETTGGPGGSDSGWQDDPSYTDTGLSNGVEYCYQVKARDKSPGQNETAWSSTECATSQTNPPTTDYYIDSVGGDDNADGLTPSTAWKSHTKVHTVVLKPGDSVQFKRGSQFSGPIVISESGASGSPILLTDYGEGNAPRFTNPDDLDMNGNCIRISGDYIIVENLYFHDTPPTDNDEEFESIFKMGAIFNMKGADYNIIRDNTFSLCTKGIQSTGEYTLITNNYLDGPSHALWWDGVAEGAWGPMGIHLGIGNQEISYNTIKNYLTTDSPYGIDGGAIEFDDGRWHKDNLYVHHNFSEGNAGFFESSWEYDTPPESQEVHNLRVAFNVSIDGQSYCYLWAPTHNTYFDNNIINRNNSYPDTDPQDPDLIIASFSGVTFRNNLIVGTQYSNNHSPYWGDITVQNDWYWEVGTTYGDGDPLLVDFYGGDYHLTASSPLIGQAQNLSQYYSTDFDGVTLPTSGLWDIGAYMFVEATCNLPGIYVDDDASPGGDGTSWATAYKYLQDALSTECWVDEIWVAGGIYKPDQGGGQTPGDRNATFRLRNGVAIRGGYAGYGTADPNERDPNTYETILSGDLNGNDGPDFANNAENSYHVVTGSGTDTTAVIDGFTITAGNANGEPWPDPTFFGGGIWNDSGSPTVTNCTFSGNSTLDGGAMCNYNGSSPTVTNCTFSGTLTVWSTGGMANYFNSSPTVTNCTFIGNSAFDGGGMGNWDNSSPTVTGCTFSGNSASEFGGGMSNGYESNPTLTNCTFTSNSAGDRGGGMENDYNSSPTLTNCTFSGNSAGGSGGGMINGEGSPTVTNCTFTGNWAGESGGGMGNYDGSNPTLTNCILWGNEAPYRPEIYGSASVSYSDVQGGWYGTENINADPLFIDASSGDLRLLPDSPCIDAGDNTAVPAGVTTDLDGNPRFVDQPEVPDTGNGTAPIVDMGAFEADYIQAQMKFTPQALNPGSQGNWVKAHFVLPDGFDVNDVDANTPAMLYPGGIPSEVPMNVFINEDGFVEIEAAFDRAAFCSNGSLDGAVTVVGLLTTGQEFYGTDTIRIITGNLEYVAVLAAHWLEADCSKPNWCGGIDLDQDSVVDFVDFAMFDGCCIEIKAK